METLLSHSTLRPVATRILAFLMPIPIAAFGAPAHAAPAPPATPPAAASETAKDATPWPVMELKTRRVAIDPVFGAHHELTVAPNAGETSPDATKRLLIHAAPGARGSDLYVSTLLDAANPDAGPPSSEAARVTTLETVIHEAHWLLDSRNVVFQTGRGPTSTVWILDTHDAAPTPKRLLADIANPTSSPIVSRNGAVALLAETKRVGKARHFDLLVVRNPLATPAEKPRVVAQDLDVFALAWSHDGSRLAFSSIDVVTLWNAADATTTSLRYDSAAPPKTPDSAPSDGFLNCAAHHLAFSNDDASLACTPRFVGGRFVDRANPDAGRLYADDKVVVFDLRNSAKPIVLTGDDRILGLSWTTSADAARDAAHIPASPVPAR
ncbi:MAG: hypothetical protein IPK69_06425 [Phycisphaerales bacterium]|nr:MAG: hypothetical protein IPK69_06425 [Phycisphaerales bacterium]